MNKYKKEVIDPGDKASKLAHQICQKSYENCSAVRIIVPDKTKFRGPVDFTWADHVLVAMLRGQLHQAVENDGAGGKPQFFTLVGTPEVFFDLGWEIITMTADDIARWGKFPVLMVNELCVKHITQKNFHLVESLFRGYGRALSRTKLVNITGEVAVMKHSITAFCDLQDPAQLIVTWGGTCFGLSSPDRLIDGRTIRPGMSIIGFWELGYRCNGGTAFTNLLLAKFGPNVKDIMHNEDARLFVKDLTTPSKSYARLITYLNGWNDDGSLEKEPRVKMHGIAHITGGGIWEKLGQILPEGVGAHLSSMPRPADALFRAQAWSFDFPKLRLSDWQAHGTFHGGCGMLVVVEPEDKEEVISAARTRGIIAGVVGETIPSSVNEIVIESNFLEAKTLSSLKPE